MTRYANVAFRASVMDALEILRIKTVKSCSTVTKNIAQLCILAHKQTTNAMKAGDLFHTSPHFENSSLKFGRRQAHFSV